MLYANFTDSSLPDFKRVSVTRWRPYPQREMEWKCFEVVILWPFHGTRCRALFARPVLVLVPAPAHCDGPGY